MQDFCTHPNVNWKPWGKSTGPTSYLGKLKVSRNALRHGYYRAAFREFRKTKRSDQGIVLEKTCLQLIKIVETEQFDKLELLLNELENQYNEFSKQMDQSITEVKTMTEFQYITMLSEKTLQYSLRCTLKHKDNNIKQGENNEEESL